MIETLKTMDGNRSRGRAVLFMLLSSFCFALMGASVKYAVAIPVVQKVFFRNFIILILMVFSLRAKVCKMKTASGVSSVDVFSPEAFFKPSELYLGHKGNRKALLFRSLLGLTGVISYFYTIDNLGLADSSMLSRLSPFFVTIFAALFLGEKISRIQVPALTIAFTGALFIIKPSFDLTIIPSLTGLLSAIAAGGAYTIIRSLKGKENPDTVIFWFSTISCLGMALPTIIGWKSPSFGEWIALLSVGLTSAGGQFFLTRAYLLAPAGAISIYNYTNILFSLVLGFFFFSEFPDFWALAGGFLIILVALALFLYMRNPASFSRSESL
ncbi:MAG: DMT family transporter [Spirochaetales bacterium]|nr:DMT family transporter [Spirochaetales bacterium]